MRFLDVTLQPEKNTNHLSANALTRPDLRLVRLLTASTKIPFVPQISTDCTALVMPV